MLLHLPDEGEQDLATQFLVLLTELNLVGDVLLKSPDSNLAGGNDQKEPT